MVGFRVTRFAAQYKAFATARVARDPPSPLQNGSDQVLVNSPFALSHPNRAQPRTS